MANEVREYLTESEIRRLVHGIVGPMLAERDKKLGKRLDTQDADLNTVKENQAKAQTHLLEIYGNGSGRKGVLEGIRDEQQRMHRENVKARESDREEIDKRLEKIEEATQRSELKKDVLKEVLEEQAKEQAKKREEQEEKAKKRMRLVAVVDFLWKSLGGPAIAAALLFYFWSHAHPH